MPRQRVPSAPISHCSHLEQRQRRLVPLPEPDPELEPQPEPDPEQPKKPFGARLVSCVVPRRKLRGFSYWKLVETGAPATPTAAFPIARPTTANNCLGYFQYHLRLPRIAQYYLPSWLAT
ncbi:hypothetical protein AWZ03_009056 [Drosophila navojoa]|uniref:Uncharacterized protein n=1 Tax=Drosophila navojoa TaxID=7232 RepID=A0A484B7A5_DRONA|nr:hypothetical protein AWZ03_009056 [Drosophila navojoa]